MIATLGTMRPVLRSCLSHPSMESSAESFFAKYPNWERRGLTLSGSLKAILEQFGVSG